MDFSVIYAMASQQSEAINALDRPADVVTDDREEGQPRADVRNAKLI